MRLTEFWERMAEAFGSTYAESLARDQALSALGSRTVIQALDAGESPRAVWQAVAEQFDLPASMR